MDDRADRAAGELQRQSPAQTAVLPPRRLRSDDLFRGSREVMIEHDGDCYRLRCTSRGKLILTK